MFKFLVLSYLVFVGSTSAQSGDERAASTAAMFSTTAETNAELDDGYDESEVSREPTLSQMFVIESIEQGSVAAEAARTVVEPLTIPDVLMQRDCLRRAQETFSHAFASADVSEHDRLAATRGVEVALRPALEGVCHFNFRPMPRSEDVDVGSKLADVRELQLLAYRAYARLLEKSMRLFLAFPLGFLGPLAFGDVPNC